MYHCAYSYFNMPNYIYLSRFKLFKPEIKQKTRKITSRKCRVAEFWWHCKPIDKDCWNLAAESCTVSVFKIQRYASGQPQSTRTAGTVNHWQHPLPRQTSTRPGKILSGIISSLSFTLFQWWAKWRLSTFDLYPWGEGHGVQGQICDISRP